jgi:hypothetical protein
MTEVTDAPPTAGPLKRIALAIATALVSINIWTGCPLFAVWVGAQSASSSAPSMGPIVIVVVVLAVLVGGSAVAMSWLGAKYDDATGRPPAARRTSPWLRSMRGEREEFARSRQGISGLERVVVFSVVLCVVAFEVWFFFFAGSSLPNQ